MHKVAQGVEPKSMIFFPKSNLIKWWIIWILYKSSYQIPYLISQANNSAGVFDLSEWTEDFIGGFFSPWFNGAGASSFELVSGTSVLLDLYIAIAILLRIRPLIPSVNKVMWLLFGLAMYTIWLEPWICLALLHPEEWLSYLVSELLLKEVLLIPIDAGFSWLWFFWTLCLWDSIDREFR